MSLVYCENNEYKYYKTHFYYANISKSIKNIQ